MMKWLLMLDRASGVIACCLVGMAIGMMYLPVLFPLESVQRVALIVGLRVEYWGVLALLMAGGAAVGLIAGLAIDAIRGTGAKAAEKSPINDLLARIGRNFPDLTIGMRNMTEQWVGGMRVTLAEAAIARGRNFDSGPSSSTQTVACYEEPGARIPRFSLAPKGVLLKVVGAMGLPNMHFADQPEFAQKFFVLATEPLGTQSLLNLQVRAWLLAHPAMHMEGGGTGVLVYRRGEVLTGTELETFTQDAAELLRLVDQRRRATESAGARPSSIDEARAFAAQLPKSMQRSFEKELKAQTVTRKQADDFVRLAPPRDIPPNIAHRYRGTQGMMAIGATFVGMAALVGYLGFSQRQSIGGLVFLLLFMGIGALIFAFSCRSWWRERRLLRNGELAVARIRSVDSTGWTDGDDEVFRMGAQYQLAGESHAGVGKVKGQVGQYAKNLAADGKMTAILSDAADRRRILLVDSLVYPPEC